MKAIIFGANGQDGFYLGKILERRQIETVAVSRTRGDATGDAADWDFVEQLIKTVRPAYIFHFAADSTARHEAIFENHRAISTGTINILEAARRHSPESRIFLPGSALQFENLGAPVDENTPFAPTSAYAVARIYSVYAGRYFRSLGLKIYTGYLFNHDSPLRAARHVNQKIALAARNIRPGERLEIGDPSVRKEFNFAADIMQAVWLLVNQERVFEAVIGSGKAHSIREWLELCFALAGKDWREYVEIREDYQPEYKTLVSNPSLIKSLGWEPKTGIKELAEMMVKGRN